MNERIQELASFCNEEVGDYQYGSIISFNYEKFAKLIVQEVLLKANGARIRGESMNELIERIKEDFGVEE